MSDSAIEWTNKTWNPLRGCTKVAAGCKNCYAIPTAARIVGIGRGPTASAKLQATGESYARTLTPDLSTWSGRVELVPDALDEPLRWRRPQRVFVNSMSDLFHDEVPFEYIAAVFATMAIKHRDLHPDVPQDRYVILTKRPTRAQDWFRWMANQYSSANGRGMAFGGLLAVYGQQAGNQRLHAKIAENTQRLFTVPWPLPNVAIGVSVSNQADADELLPALATIPARWRIVSAEPLLGPVRLSRWMGGCWGFVVTGACHAPGTCGRHQSTLDQVIIGGESGPGARPCKLRWAQDLAKQVLDAGVPLFVKQLDVCPSCNGAGEVAVTWASIGTWEPCPDCMTRPGYAGKLRKGCPALHILGHGAHSWQQYPEGWV